MPSRRKNILHYKLNNQKVCQQMFLNTFEITNNHINRLLKIQGWQGQGVGSGNYVRNTLLTRQVKEIIHDVVEQMPKFNIHYSDTSKEAENVVYLAPTKKSSQDSHSTDS